MSAIWSWLQSHSAVLSAFGVAIIDFIWAMAPSLKGNGIFHAIYVFLGGKSE